MFSSTLSDRLKAAVNQLEATGAAYQARALASRDPSQPPSANASSSNLAAVGTTTGAVDTVPHPAIGRTASSGAGGEEKPDGTPSSPAIKANQSLSVPASPSIGTSVSPTSPNATHSPTRSSTSQLAEHALSGLRKSFHFRSSLDGNHSQPQASIQTQQSEVGKEGAAGVISDDPLSIPLPPSPAVSSTELPEIENGEGARDTVVPQLRVDTGVSTPTLAAPAQPDPTTPEANGTTNGTSTTHTTLDTTAEPAKPEHVPDDQLRSRYETLAAQVVKADAVFKSLTPLEGGVEDVEALEGWVRMVTSKVEMMGEEMKRMQSKLDLQASRMEELRDTHRLESQSQTELVAKLRTQLSTAENNFSAKAGDLMQLGQLRADLSKAQTQAKEEEEKRTKAISLLKTVRQKLVKLEKDKEEIERDRAEERAERSRAIDEAERTKAEREREVTNLRKGFERELSSAKERHDKDLSTRKAAWELEMITTKAAHAKELSNKTTKITGLEAIVKELNATKAEMFDTIQARQEEAEVARGEAEGMQTRTKELEFQLREALERCAILEDATRGADALGPPGGSRSRGRSASPAPGQSAADVQRLLAEAESRAESKLSDLRVRVRSLESERNELEEEWATKLQERVRELEKLRRAVQEKEGEYADVLRTRREKEARIEELERREKGLEKEMNEMKVRMESVKGDVGVAAEAERIARDEMSSLQIQISTLQSQLEDAKGVSTQLRSTNKTLRDELRKVQSSVTLLERQRGPGVGYWASDRGGSGTGGGAGCGSIGSVGAGVTSPTKSPEPVRASLESIATTIQHEQQAIPGTASTPDPNEEEVNLEYLRNVIIQFLEHKEMRPNLVRVMSVILRFTPQELRRLNAKLLT